MSRHTRILWLSLCLLLARVPASQAQPGGAKPTPKAQADAQTDGLPPGAVVRLGSVRLRHPSGVQSVAFSPDGKRLASAGSAGDVRLWDAATGRSLLQLPPGTGILVRFLPNGKELLCDGSEQGLALWDMTTGKRIRPFGDKGQQIRPMVGGAGDHCVALSPDGKMLAEVGGTDVVLWETATGRLLRRLTASKTPLYCVAFSPDGKTLAVGDGTGRVVPGLPGKGDTTIGIWDIGKGKKIATLLHAHHGWIYALAFSPDGKTLASSSPYATCLWDLTTHERRTRFAAGGRSLQFTRDGKLLAVAMHYGGMDRGFIHLWDPVTGKSVHTLRGHVSVASCVAFAPDGKLLASGGQEGAVLLWDTASGRQTLRRDGHQAEIRSVAFAPNGMLAATASGGDHSIRIWGTASGTPLARMDIPCGFRSHWCPTTHAAHLAFAPDGKTVICDDREYTVATGRLLKDLPGKVLAHSADGKRFAGLAQNRYSGHGTGVAVWDRASGRELARFTAHEQGASHDAEVTAAALSPDGRLLAVGVSNRRYRLNVAASDSVYLYAIASGKLLRKFRPQNSGPRFLAFSPDGELLVTSATWEQPAQLWRVVNGKELRKLAGQEERRHWAEYRPIAFSPNGKLLALAGKENAIILWEVTTGQQVHRLLGHRAPVRALAFAPDGRKLLSASADTTALIWNLGPVDNKTDLSAAGLERIWEQLAGDDAAAAYRAGWALVAAPDKAVDLFKQRLKALPTPDLKRIPRLIEDLGAGRFAVRETASRALKELGPLAEGSLRKTLDGQPTLEVRRRIEGLLAEIHKRPISPAELRQLRAIQILEWLGTPAAAELLEPLARGAPALLPTRDAVAVLWRLHNRRADAVASKLVVSPRTKPVQAAAARTLAKLPTEITALALTNTGKLFAATAADGTVLLLDRGTGKELRRFKAVAKQVLAVVVTPDGKLVVTGGSDRIIRFWDTATGRQVTSLGGHTGPVSALALTPDGKLLASGSLDRTIVLWEMPRGRFVRKLKGHRGRVTSVSFSADGKRLVSGDLARSVHKINRRSVASYWSDAVRVWDVATGKELQVLKGGGNAAAFSPDGQLFATAEFATEITIGGNAIHLGRGAHYNLVEGTQQPAVREKPEPGDKFEQGATVKGNYGQVVINGSQALALWDTDRYRIRWRLADRGAAFAFSPDGRFLATARGSDLHHSGKLVQTPGAVSGDGRLRVWEIATGQEVMAFPAGAQPTGFAFAPDGTALLAGMRDGSVLQWDLRPDRAQPPREQDMAQMWNTLASDDAAAAYRALWALRARGPQAVRFLKERLQPAAADDPTLRRLVAALDAAKWETREGAFKELTRRGADAQPALCLALQQTSSEIVRQQILKLLTAPEILEHTDALGRSRALAVLEGIGSPEARQLLELLARGSPMVRQTQEARAALERVKCAIMQGNH